GFGTWAPARLRRVAAEQEVGNELLTGADLVRGAAARATGQEAAWLRAQADALARVDDAGRIATALAPALAAAMARHPDRSLPPDSTAVLAGSVQPGRAAS